MRIFSTLILLTSAFIVGCRSDSTSRGARDTAETHAARDTVRPFPTDTSQNFSSDSLERTNVTSSPTTFRRNASMIVACVDSLNMIDSLSFSLSLSIIDVKHREGMESLAEGGQALTARPQFVLDSSGRPEPEDERNKRLLSLRSVQQGDTIRATISLNPSAGWVILNTD